MEVRNSLVMARLVQDLEGSCLPDLVLPGIAAA